MARPRLVHSNLKVPPLPILIDAEARYIDGMPGYAVDSIGRIWSCKVERSSKFGHWHEIKPSMDKFGRSRVNLRVNSIRKVYLIHQLVAKAFLGRCPGKIVCHRDGNNKNNRVENLYYGTQSDNMKDAIRHGTHNRFKAKSQA